MRVLFIAPLPPPTTGHSVAAAVFLDDLRRHHDTDVLDLSVASRLDGSVTGRRILAVIKVLAGVWRKRRTADSSYLTISEAVAGNLKDLMVYLLCCGHLSKMYIHLHGGSLKRLLLDRHRLLRLANAAFVRRLGGVIVSGESHLEIFAGMVSPRKIHVVPNCAPGHLFVDREVVIQKYATLHPLRVLYISNMTEAKGATALVQAYLRLGADTRKMVSVDFAGRFERGPDEARFVGKIAGIPGLRYHGFIDEACKQRLFAQAHVFCLPTAMFEGQPISILEAYASGCAVLTTGQPGIRDVFHDGVNGFEIRGDRATSIAGILEALVRDPGRLTDIGMRNRGIAESEYTAARFTSRLRAIVAPEGL